MDLFRDAPIGQLIRFATKNRLLAYPEESPNFTLPDATSNSSSDDAIVVGWYGADDAANPQNWSNTKRGVVSFVLWFYTFTVYATASIYINSIGGIMAEFHVGQIAATLGFSLYVLGYGIGPMVFSPLGEIAAIGRNPTYILTMVVFVVLSVPTSFTPTYGGLLVLRFLQGIFGSPCLATGGATVADMYSMAVLPYAMLAWVSASYFAPALGPLLSGFIVPATNWRWALHTSLILSAFALVLMLLLLPETSHDNILLRRAARISRSTGLRVIAPCQARKGKLDAMGVFMDAIIKPLEISIKDPAILFVQIYTSIIYGIYYSFFEAFPLVYPSEYGMSTSQLGLIFLCILVGGGIGILIYSAIVYSMSGKATTINESRLVPALGFVFAPTIGLFLFAWSARSSIHWIVPTIGITMFAAGGFVVFQCIFIYVPISYPQYAASLFAANGFFRSTLAAGSVLFAHPLFENLGIARGVSLLGGLSVIGIVGMWLLYMYGAKLRAMSRFTA